MKNSKYFATVLVLLCSFESSGASVEVSLSQQCAMAFDTASTDTPSGIKGLLESVLPSVVTGESIQATVGILSEIKDLMRTSGASAHVASFATDLIQYVIANHRGHRTVLGNTADQLHRFRTDENTILLCVLGGSCRLTYGSALHMLVTSPNFSIVSFKTGHERTERKVPGWLQSSHRVQQQLIVMNGGNQQDVARWTTNFFHEATHFADFVLISDWIKANLALLKDRKMPDELFAQYVRVAADGRLEIDEGFLRIFLEGRAYSVEIIGFSNILPPLEFRRLQNRQRERAMNDIQSFGEVTASSIRRLNLSASNIFETGERMGQTMSATIQKAHSLQRN